MQSALSVPRIITLLFNLLYHHQLLFCCAYITNQLAGTNSKCKEALFFIPVHVIGFIVSITFASREGWWLLEGEREREKGPMTQKFRRRFRSNLQTDHIISHHVARRWLALVGLALHRCGYHGPIISSPNSPDIPSGHFRFI